MEKNIPGRARRVILILLFCCSSVPVWGQNRDIEWLRQVNVHRDRSLDGVMEGITNSVFPIVGALPLTQLIVGYARHDTQVFIQGLQTTATLGVNLVFTFGLKYAVNRSRPYVTYPDIQPYQRDTDPSFPSGHTSFAFATATCLSLQYRKWYVVAPSFLWAGAAGYSRMHLGMHYPGDVFAGAVIGAGSAWLGYKGQQWLLHHRNKRKIRVHD